ncbi:MAG: hypothetical protein HOG42_05480 [Methylococcales bacterium]|nr:hypothetical protein [Methylococcales bacterium]
MVSLPRDWLPTHLIESVFWGQSGAILGAKMPNLSKCMPQGWISFLDD